MLLKNGANINIQDREKSTALVIAAEKGHYEVVQLLLREKADISVRDKGGTTALHRAAKYGHEEIVHLLLGKGVDTAAKDRDGWTALHITTEVGEEAVMHIIKKKFQYQRDPKTGSDDGSSLSGQQRKGRYRNKLPTDGETWLQSTSSPSISYECPTRTLEYHATRPHLFKQNQRDDEKSRNESRARQRDYRPRHHSQPHQPSYEHRSTSQSYDSTYEGARWDNSISTLFVNDIGHGLLDAQK
jgi:Ankyrin repeats (3 copies)